MPSIARTASRAGIRACTFAAVLLLQGCATAAWYAQSVAGHARLLLARQDPDAALADPDIAPEIRARLAEVPALLRFATQELGLPDNGSYRTVVMLDRQYVAWNVFATPPLSLAARQWCYPIAGCVAYRGYFSVSRAQAEARRLAAAGNDVYVGGVAAYSTLGWFRDPILSPMLRMDSDALAAVLLHELAHQKVWLRGDAELNEAFAEAVARIGRQRLADRKGPAARAELDARLEQEDRFQALVLEHREALRRLYASALPDADKLARKQAQFAELRRDYVRLKRATGDPGRFDAWLARDLNNATLLAFSTYRSLVPGLLAIHAGLGRNPETFYDRIRRLASCDREVRHAWVRAGGRQAPCWSESSD
jgi:predicted aminopeptidase